MKRTNFSPQNLGLFTPDEEHQEGFGENFMECKLKWLWEESQVYSELCCRTKQKSHQQNLYLWNCVKIWINPITNLRKLFTTCETTKLIVLNGVISIRLVEWTVRVSQIMQNYVWLLA